MNKVFKRTVMLSAALLMTSSMYAAVIGAGTDASGAGVNVVGCGDPKPQQAMGVTVKCKKTDGTEGKQCVTSGKGDACALKLIDCQ